MKNNIIFSRQLQDASVSSVKLKTGYGIGNQNQDPISVSVSEPFLFFLLKLKLFVFSNFIKTIQVFLLFSTLQRVGCKFFMNLKKKQIFKNNLRNILVLSRNLVLGAIF